MWFSLSSCTRFPNIVGYNKKKEKKYDKRELRIKKRDRNKRKNKREITKRGREWIINIYHTLPWSFKTINLMPQPNSGSKCSFIECNTWNSNADKRIQKFKKIFLLICQFRNEREAGEKTAPWNVIVLGLLLRKSIINEGPDYMSSAVLARLMPSWLALPRCDFLKSHSTDFLREESTAIFILFKLSGFWIQVTWVREKFLKPNVLCILIGQACDQALSEKRPMASTVG